MTTRTLFLGSNFEALETLKTLNDDNRFEIAGVITQPDKPVGRKKEIVETEIKRHCREKDIEVFHTENKKGKYKEALDIFKPDLIVCKSFGEIIPEFFLNFPKFKSINIHFSLLPKYRGAVPIQMAILNNDKTTGISIIEMTTELDSGDILAQYEEDIKEDDTNITLRERLVKKTTEVLPNVLEEWIEGNIKTTKQNEKEATYCFKEDISKEKAKINFEKETAQEIQRKVRAFVPWPVAWMEVNKKKAKVFETKKRKNVFLKPKEFKTDNFEFLIGTKKETIEIKKIQIEGKKEMDVKEFLNGVGVFELG